MRNKQNKVLVFVDLDGSLLDENYDCSQVKPAIRALLSAHASIVLSSSKTKREIEFYRKDLGITDPFVAENGSAIFIPKKYFKTTSKSAKHLRDYDVIKLGVAYSEVVEKLAKVRNATGAKIVGFRDMTTKDIGKQCGLSLDLARLAKKREYDEPFMIVEGDEGKVLKAILDEHLSCTRGGRFFHAMGHCDKGKAAAILKDLYSHEYEHVVTFGVGNSPNDLPMLNLVDKPFYIAEKQSKESFSKVWQEVLQQALSETT